MVPRVLGLRSDPHVLQKARKSTSVEREDKRKRGGGNLAVNWSENGVASFGRIAFCRPRLFDDFMQLLSFYNIGPIILLRLVDLG